MRKLGLSSLFLLSLLASPAPAQYIGAGSTPQGDYLRGVGVAAWGIGTYEVNDAVATSINVNTAIRLDTYISGVLRAGRDNWAKINKQAQEKSKKNYEAIRERIREHPEGIDIFSGKALDAAFEQMNNDKRIQDSSFRSILVPIPHDMLRRIPFRLDEKGIIFSLQRLTGRGKGNWPVAFQQDQFAPQRRAFERAINTAMEQLIEGKILTETIENYEMAVSGLSKQLQAEYGRKPIDRIYTEAKTRLNEMGKATELLKTTKIQAVMAELDCYTGTTVNDLRKFMQAHNLKFAPAEYADERRTFVDLYAAIDQVRQVVVEGNNNAK